MNSNSNQNPFSNLTTNQKWAAGIVAAIVLMCGIFSIGAATFQMGRMSGARQGQGYMVDGRGAAPAPPQAPDAPNAPRFENDRQMGSPFGARGRQTMNARMSGFGVFGIIGGFFRLIFTILFFGFIFMLVRRFVFGRRGWGPGPMGWRGGPGAWKHEHGVPPHFEEWHRRTHEQPKDAPTTAPTDTPTVAADETTPTEPTPPTDEGKLV